MNVPAKFEGHSFSCSLVKRGSQKFVAVPGYAITLSPSKKSYMHTIQNIYLCALVYPRFSIAVLSGDCELANPQSWGRGGRMGLGWYRSKER